MTSVAVVGTGVVGAAAGYQLARAGAEVTLVDAGVVGQATAAGAGIVCPWSSSVEDPHWYRLARAGAEHYPDLLAALAEAGESDIGYRQVGALRLATDTDVASIYQRTAGRAAESPLAGQVSVVTAEQARELFPPLGHTGPAVHVAGGARVDGRKLRDALRRAAARLGARTLTGPAELDVDRDRVRGVLVSGERVACDAVVVAAGAWAPALLEPLGVRVSVVPQRGQIVHLGLPGTDTSAWPVVLPAGSHYLLAFADSRVVVGATRESGSGFDHRVTAAGLAEVLTEALAVAPGLASATHLETRIGFRPVGPDIRPLLGTVPSVSGLVIANGLGASGLTMGPYVGALAARLALGEDAGIDLTAYDPLRG